MFLIHHQSEALFAFLQKPSIDVHLERNLRSDNVEISAMLYLEAFISMEESVMTEVVW